MMLKVTFGAKERGGGEVIIGTAGKNSHWTRKGKLRQRNYQYLQPKIKTQNKVENLKQVKQRIQSKL